MGEGNLPLLLLEHFVKYDYPAPPSGDVPQISYQPATLLPIGPEQAKALKVGDKISVHLEARVKGVNSTDDSSSADLELISSEVMKETANGESQERKGPPSKADVYRALTDGD